MAVAAILGGISLGLGILGSVGGLFDKKEQRESQAFSLEASARQALSDAETARANAEILETQRDSFIRQQEEVITDIGEQGASISAERAALAAAEGFGGGGTARSVQSNISRRVSRDITRVRDSISEQTSIFDLQQEQQLAQAAAFEEQATFATKEAGDLDDVKWYKPSTWF